MQTPRLNQSPIDVQENGRLKVEQIVRVRDFELLKRETVGSTVVRSLRRGGETALTFPASLAMNAVSDDVPSRFTAYVSSSLPPHTTAAFIAGKLSDMLQIFSRRDTRLTR